MKVYWKRATAGALLLLISVAAEEKRCGGNGFGSGGVSNPECGDVDDLGAQDLMKHQRSLMDGIKSFFSLENDVKKAADKGRVSVGRDSSLQRRLNIFKHYYPLPSADPITAPIQLPSSPTGGGIVYKHYWPLSTSPIRGEPFEARVLVGFVGNPYDLSDPERRALEDAFFDAYVSLDDREDIAITSVRIIEDLDGVNSAASQRRSLQGTIEEYLDFTKLLGITGKCTNCKYNPRLFPDGISGRKLSVSMAPHHYFLREESLHRATQEESCVGCPTKDDFITRYNDAITDLRSDGSLMNVVSLDRTIVEQEPVDCTSNITDFETTLYVTFNTSADPSGAELDALAASFVESYNQVNALNGKTCDKLFRVAIDAKISRATDNLTNDQNRKLASGPYKAKVIQSGKCRGCKPGDRVTGGDISGRRTLHSRMPVHKECQEWFLEGTALLHHNRVLQSAETSLNECYCPIGEPAERLPTIEELQTVFDDNVQFLVKDGTLTSVSSVTEIVEDGQTNPSCDSNDDCDDDEECVANTCEAAEFPLFQFSINSTIEGA